MRKTLLILLLSAVSLQAETRTVTVEPGVVELKTEPILSASADIDWECLQPISLKYLQRQLVGRESSIYFDGEDGHTYVILHDVIDWDARKRDKVKWIVHVKSDGGPPDDDKVTPPDEEPIPPVEVDDQFGIGKAIYEAFANSDKAKLPEVVKWIQQYETGIHTGRVTGGQAITGITTVLERSPQWTKFATVVSSELTDAVREFGGGDNLIKNYFRELRLAIEAIK